MIMSAGVRRFALTAHVAASVGWLGAAVTFLGLSVVGLTSPEARTVRGVYLAMEPAAWLVLVPLAFTSLLTGIVMSLGTTWGLFRHYWVAFKLLITVFSTIVLLVYLGTFRTMAELAADPSTELGMVRNASPTIHAALASVLLLAATVLAVYKPGGMTPYGWRKQQQRLGSNRARTSRVRWLYLIGLIALVIALLVIIRHLTGGGFGHD